MNPDILCIGEVLWDALPAGLFLGGAPFNVACHLHGLGESVAFAGRVGDDELGREIVRRLNQRGMKTGLLQQDHDLETGFVVVSLDPAGNPSFKIVQPSAWDALEETDDLMAAGGAAKAIVFGSLAQRDPRSRRTILRTLDTNTLCVFDVNLRPPFDTRNVVEESLSRADIVKLNEEELAQLATWFDLPRSPEAGARSIASRWRTQTVCITRAERGACLLHTDTWLEHPGFSVQVADAVGAGDAFLARLLTGLLSNEPAAEMLDQANAVGAYVATRNGATPPIDPNAVETLRRISKLRQMPGETPPAQSQQSPPIET